MINILYKYSSFMRSIHKKYRLHRKAYQPSTKFEVDMLFCEVDISYVLTKWKIDWLIIYGFTSRSIIFHLYGDVTIAGEGLQNLGRGSALRAFEQGGIFIVPHLLWHGTSVFPVSSEGPPHLVLRYKRGCGGSILTRILTGPEWKSCICYIIFSKTNIWVILNNSHCPPKGRKKYLYKKLKHVLFYIYFVIETISTHFRTLYI
jgi:hypothetical protein